MGLSELPVAWAVVTVGRRVERYDTAGRRIAMKLVNRLISAIRPRRPKRPRASRPLVHATDPRETPAHSPRLEVDTESPTAVTTRSTNFR